MNQTPNFTFSKRLGNTTFQVNVYCAPDAEITYEAKLLELIRNDSSTNDCATTLTHDTDIRQAA